MLPDRLRIENCYKAAKSINDFITKAPKPCRYAYDKDCEMK